MADGNKAEPVEVSRVTINSLGDLNKYHAEQEAERRTALVNNNPRMALLRAALTNNLGATDLIRTEFLRFMLDGPREIDADCGYPAWLTPDHYRALYDREGHAARVVHCEPEESWALDPDLYEDNPKRSEGNAADEDVTAFEAAWDALETKFNLWYHLQRIDILSGIGQFGILMFGLDDGLDLHEPVEGFNDDGTVSGKAKHGLMYIRPFDESVVFVKTREVDMNNPRYGQPTLYSVQFRDFPNWGVQAGEVIARDIHWTRVLHVADNRKMSEIYGIPRMQQVYNRLYDLRKVCSADGEAFWKGGFPGISFEIAPEIADQGIDLDKDSLREEMAAYQNGLQRYFAVQGVTAKTMAPALADPTPHVEMQLKMIAIAKSVPYRILFGTEEAKLAGDQDNRNWNKRVARRQTKYVTPMLIRPFVDRLIDYGVLPAPKKPYTVKWPDLNNPTPQDKAAVALQKTQALGTYVQQGVSQIMNPDAYLTHVMGETQDTVQDMLEGAGDDQLGMGGGSGETDMGDPDYMAGGDEGTGHGGEPGSEEGEGGLNDTNVIGADALEQRDLSGHTTIGTGKKAKRVDDTWVSQPELNAERKPGGKRRPEYLPHEPEDENAPDLEDIEYTEDRPTGNEDGSRAGRWVTIEHVHVFISGGKITKGPKGMMGKTPGELPPRRAGEKTKISTPADAQGHSTERVPSDPAAGAYWAGTHANDRAGHEPDAAHKEIQAALLSKRDTHKHILRDAEGKVAGAISFSNDGGKVRVSHLGSHVKGGEAKLMKLATAHGELHGLTTERGLKELKPGEVGGTLADHTDEHGHLTPERQALHRQIIDKYLAHGTPQAEPHVLMMGGGPAAGKSSIIASGAVSDAGHVPVDPDSIKGDLPEYRMMTAAGDKRAAAYAHEESSHVSKKVAAEALKSNKHVLMDSTGDGGADSLEQKVKGWRKLGAKRVVAEYVTAPTEVAVARAEERGKKTGRFVDPNVVRHIHREVSKTFPEALKRGLFDEARLWDTHTGAGEKPVLVLSHKDGKTTIHDPERWQAFLDKANE